MKKGKRSIIIILVMIGVFLIGASAWSIQSKRSALYGGLPLKLLYFNSYDEFSQFHKKNSKNKEEKVFILDLTDKFDDKPVYDVLGSHDCGKHMLLCNNKSSSFHYLRDTCYRQTISAIDDRTSVGCYIFFERYYSLDNPNLIWTQVDKSDDEFVRTPLLKNDSRNNDTYDRYYYKLIDETKNKTLLLVYFSSNQSEDGTTTYCETVIEEAKEKILAEFTETYL